MRPDSPPKGPAAAPPLPIDAVLPDLCRALRLGPNAVLEAPPGAGKTTRVPLALLDEPWVAGKRILMLEPRRLAARAAARRMAATLGEAAGETVGYRTRLESKVGPRTRIEVVTEGILIRRLQSDPGLDGVAAVLFDEFHERSLDADLGLALCLESQAALAEDLRLVAMSATLDGARVAALMGGAPRITSEGRSFPVALRYAERTPDGPIEAAVAAAIQRALAEETGSLLVFLPGAGEIRRTQARLEEAGLPQDVILAPLYGDLAPEAQDQAIAPAPVGRRKVVLATAIAETSLTIDGIRVVIDSGLMRRPRFEPGSGLTRLETLRVSRASADQRAGRAGRLEPGLCYRLWTEAENHGLIRHTAPEILDADLAPLALELAAWGAPDPATLPFLDPPPAAAYAQAVSLLRELGAIAGEPPRPTAHGQRMLTLGLHPRLAHMVLTAQELGLGPLAATIAALLEERDILRGRMRDSDLRTRLEVLESGGRDLDRAAVARVRRQAGEIRRRLRIADATAADTESAGLVLAFAYPDRIGQRRGGDGQYRLANGRGAYFAEPEPLSAADWIVAAELDGARRAARIFLAAPLQPADLTAHFAAAITPVDQVAWDSRAEAVTAQRQERLGALVLSERPLPHPDPQALAAAMIEGVRALGLAALPWTPAQENWRARIAFLRRLEGPDSWPDLSDAGLLETLESWLGPRLDGISRRAHLARLDLGAALSDLLSWEQRRRLDEAAPTHVAVPSGSRIAIDYSGPQPVLAVKLQEMFGAAQAPAIAGGRARLLVHLLSPAGRPLAVTEDLASFWANAYRDVRAQMRGQYPRHPWPEDPLTAPPTRRAKPRGS